MTTNEELRELAGKATAGEWVWEYYGSGYGEPPEGVGIADVADFGFNVDDAHYVSAVNPARVLALLDDLEAVIEALRVSDVKYRERTERMRVLEMRLQRVKDLHKPDVDYPKFCGHCTHPQDAAWSCEYPCPTIRALESN